MRVGILVAGLMAGCSFNVQGTAIDNPGAAAAQPSPTQSLPDGPDAATEPPAPAPPAAPTPTPPAPPDMTQQRVGLACTSDAQCDPGLICAQSFNVGLSHISIPDGYCTLECGSKACPPNSFCNSFAFGKYCLSACPPDPCRTSYVCCDEGGDNKGCAPTSLCPGGKGD
jgi:hypothetical protein